jgi:ubiquinone/menaquinone biosynthesis C-methylase UbiE
MTAPPNPSQSFTLGVPELWDTIADSYAQDVTPFFTLYAEEALRLVRLERTARVLDVACGPGTLAFCAAPHVAHVTGVDFSPKMIDALCARAEREGVGNVEGELMDAAALRFADATFDAAFCAFAFMFFPDRDKAFREMRRVLRDGGKALVITWAPIERRPFIQLGFDALREAIPQIPPMPKGDLQDPAACIAEMTAAGFRDVVVHPFTASMRIESAERYLDTMERSGAGFSAIRARAGEDKWPLLRARILEAVRRRIPAEGVELPAEALLSLGVR